MVKRNSKEHMLKNYFYCIGLVSLIGSLFHTSLPEQSVIKDDFYSWSRTFAQLMHTFENKYYTKPPVQEAMIKAMKSFVSCDAHSSFLDPKAFEEILQTTSGSFSGIGVILEPQRTSGPFKIASIIPEMPADKAGLKAQDFIIALDDKSTFDMPYMNFVEKLRGPRHTKVTLTILRNTQVLTVTVTRDIIIDETVFSYIIGDKDPILYIALKQFCQNSYEKIASAHEIMRTKKIQGLILDLRDNSGGLLQAGIDIVGLFVPRHSIVVISKDSHNKILEEYRTTHEPLIDKNSFVCILVNPLTASAGEIVAGALQYYTRTCNQCPPIVVVGETTFGKSSLQEVIPLSNNCAVKLTTGLYALPDHSIIQNKGITPDIVVEKLYQQSEHERAIKNLLTCEKHLVDAVGEAPQAVTSTQPKDWKELRKQALKNDNQLQTAVNALHNWSLYADCSTKKPKQRRENKHMIEWLSNQILQVITPFIECDLPEKKITQQ